MGHRKETCAVITDDEGFVVVLRGQVIGDIRWLQVVSVDSANLDGLVIVRFSRVGCGGQCNIDSDCNGFERVMGLAVERIAGFPVDWQRRVLRHQPKGHTICVYKQSDQVLQQTAGHDSFL